MNTLGSQNDKHYFFIYSFAVLIFSYCLFFSNYQYPPDLYWDENYHVAFAYKYIHGIFYQEIHPPFGKLMIYAGEMIWSPNATLDTCNIGEQDFINSIPPKFSFVGLRFFPAVFASLSCYIFFLLLYLLLQNPHVAVLLSGLYIFNNAMIVHFRGAMLDGIQMFFVIASLCLTIWIWKRRYYSILNYFFLGALIGFAIATKFNALIFVLLFAFLIFSESRLIFSYALNSQKTILLNFVKKGIVFIFAIVLVFSSIQYIHIQLTGTIKESKNYEISDSFRNGAKEGKLWNPYYTCISLSDWYKFAKKHTSKMPRLDPCNKDENGSNPIGWIIGNRSINYRWIKYFDLKEQHSTYFGSAQNKPISIEDHKKLRPKEQSKYVLVVRYLYMQINPVIWLIGLLSVVLSISLVLSHLIYGLKLKDKDTFALIVLFLMMYLAYMATLLSAERVLYMYTYFIPLVFSIILSVLNFRYLFKEKLENPVSNKIIYASLILVTVLVFSAFIFYAPFTYYWPLTEEEFQARNLLRVWNMKSIR